MAQFQRHFVQDLTKPLIVRQCGDLGFTGDNFSDVISVDLYTDGEAYSGGGTCAGACICPDGSTVALTGSVSGKTASVSLTEDCFAIPGQIGIAIRVTSGTTKTTVLKANYNVEQFSTDNPVDPGSRITLDVDTLIGRIDAATADIPASDMASLMAGIAPTFSTSTAYQVGAYVYYNGTLYRFVVPHAAGSWNASDVVQAVVCTDFKRLKQVAYLNLAGESIGKLYPVYVANGEQITISTSDGSTFNQTVKLHYWGLNKNHLGQWALGSSYGNRRAVTAGSDIYWLSFEWQDASVFGVETGETMPTPYMVNFGPSAESYHVWYENPDVRALSLAVDAQITELSGDIDTQISGIESDISGIETDITNLQNRDTALDAKIDNVSANYNQYRNDKESGFISLNANYFNADSANWNNGLVATATGNITPTTDYEYAFCPLQGEGIYITQINGSQYGTNARKMALYDAGKQFIKSIDADSYNGNNQKYTLSSADAKTAVYTILQRQKNSSTIPKLFFNPIWYDPSTFPTDSTRNLPPVYGHVSDSLYKKVFICDGDSICMGNLDNPYQWSGWYGRILRGYQTSGNNYAVGGGTIMDRTDETVGGSPRHCIALTIDTIYSQYPNLDYLILEGGTNDADLTGAFDGDTPPERFGTWDKDSYSAEYVNALDVTTFCGAVEYLFCKAITYFPNAKIGFIIPMKMGLYTYQKTVRKRYFDEIIEIAKKWGVPVLNLWDNMHVVPNFDAYYDRTKTEAQNVAAGKFYNDGQHPTTYGYNLMQNTIEAWIKSL